MDEGDYLNINISYEENAEQENGEDQAREVIRHKHKNCVDLDALIWSNLPSDIFERVLAHLPMASLARARTVSKKLNHLILSNNFVSSQADLGHARESWFAVIEAQSCFQFCAYDPDIDEWYTISLSFLPCQVRVLASSGGLLCCRGELSCGSLALVICNPMTKQWRVLPPMLKKRLVPIVSVVVRGAQGDFIVVVAGDDVLQDGRNVSDLTCEVFDSRVNRWSLSGSIPPHSDLELGSAVCNGNLYLMTYTPYGVLSFNFQHGVWTKLQAAMPKNLTIPSLVDCSGRIFIVGGIAKKVSIESVRVWELCENGTVWKEIARMKDRMFRELWLEKKEELYFNAVGHGNLICLLIYQSSQMIALDINTRLWFWLPRYPVGEAKNLLGYPYSPNLYTDCA